MNNLEAVVYPLGRGRAPAEEDLWEGGGEFMVLDEVQEIAACLQ